MAVERQPQVLAAAAGAGDGPSGEAGGEVGTAGDVPPYGARVVDTDGGDRAAGDPALDPAADDLDLGQLRHYEVWGSGEVRGSGEAWGSGTSLVLDSSGTWARRCRHAVAAASCSASFLLRPLPSP